MKFIGFLIVSLLVSNVSANDGGVYFIEAKINQLSAEEARDATGADAAFKIVGKEADLLRRSLPNTISTVRSIEENSSALAVVDKKSGNILAISCSNLDHTSFPAKKTKETTCYVQFSKNDPKNEYLIEERLGDVTKLTAPMCSK